MSWVSSLKNQWGQIQVLFKKSALDPQTLEELEDLLIEADVGIQTTTWLIQKLQDDHRRLKQGGITIQEILAHHIAERLKPYEGSFPKALDHRPYVIMMVGVNGSGKTTTCAKVAHHMQQGGLNVCMVAADLFRAGATEQLCLWGERLNIPVYQGISGQTDAAGLVFQAYKEACDTQVDVIIIDTAGRLHHRTDLMAELSKIHRVIQKIDVTAPHVTLFVLDGTSGQNGLNQLKTFQDTIPVNGLLVTKLDGTAKGGMILNLTHTFQIPLYGIGSGETTEDLDAFDAALFARALVGLEGP